MTTATLFDCRCTRCDLTYSRVTATKAGAKYPTRPVYQCPGCGAPRWDLIPEPEHWLRAYAWIESNAGLFRQQWKRGFPGWFRVLDDAEALSLSILDAATACVRWRPDRGTALGTFISNAVERVARKARARHARDRLRTGTDFTNTVARAG